MKGKLFAGVVALGLWSGAALAAPTMMVTAGTGFEGYSGLLRSAIVAGPAWGAQAAIRPINQMGLEFGYSGAANEMRNNAFDVSGADLVRNGGHVLATLDLTMTPVRPYLLGGVGVNWYTVRATSSGFTDESSGNVPLGGGLRAQPFPAFPQIVIDARLHYNVLFANNLIGQAGPASVPGYGSGVSGRVDGALSIGGTF